jgi:hypothetical protein
MWPSAGVDGPPPSQGGGGAADRWGWAALRPVPARPPATAMASPGAEVARIAPRELQDRCRNALRAAAAVASRGSSGHRQGRLGEQRAADEQVEQASDRDRGDQRYQSAGAPAHRSRQHAGRPERQHDQVVAGQHVGEEQPRRASTAATGSVRVSSRSANVRSSIAGEPSSLTSTSATRSRLARSAGIHDRGSDPPHPLTLPGLPYHPPKSSDSIRLHPLSTTWPESRTTTTPEVVKTGCRLVCRACTNRRNRTSHRTGDAAGVR